MKFVDSCEVKVVAGAGGNGCVAFRREKFVPFGGPAGGDGGRGGDVVFRTDPGLSTLLDLTYAHTLQAERGEHGKGKDCYGHAGEPLIVRVPVGTQVIDAESNAVLFDLDTANTDTVIARGGRGGRGNIHFSTPYDRAPRRAEPGEAGEERAVRLELKMMADVGLLGFPNVGKSTFIRAVSRATPKVADYPFTTLVPHLGVVDMGRASKKHEFGASFVIADIPGLIPGASDGAGLGIQFLKHVERTRALLHLITLDPSEGRDPIEDYDTIMNELTRFNPALVKRPQIVAMTKSDLPDVREAYPKLKARFSKRGIDCRLVSAANGDGVRDILLALFRLVKSPLQRNERERNDDERTTTRKKVAAKKTKKAAAKKTDAKKTVSKKASLKKPSSKKLAPKKATKPVAAITKARPSKAKAKTRATKARKK